MLSLSHKTRHIKIKNSLKTIFISDIIIEKDKNLNLGDAYG